MPNSLSEITQVKLPSDFYDMLYTLSEADGRFDRIVLYCDVGLCTVLEEMNLASRNVRGSYGGTEKLVVLVKEGPEACQFAVVKFCKKHNIKVLKERVEYFYDEITE